MQDKKQNQATGGIASNPAPGNDIQPVGNNQLLDEKAEKYLRESANIEDLPDPEEQAEAEGTN